MVTDGKSWALDPQRLARTGIRLTAVLIGEDALDAGISHLAGMTGGQSLVAASSDAGIAIAAALEAARAPRVSPQPIEGKPMQVMALRRGARVIATWDEQRWGEPGEQAVTTEARQIGATAAMLAIPLMQEGEAKALAESEGVVCHLTSLVLVDEAGVRHEGLPAVRKVALAAPAMARAIAMPVGMLDRSAAPAASRSTGRAGVLRRSLTGGTGGGLRGMIAHIDWDDDPDALCRGERGRQRERCGG